MEIEKVNTPGLPIITVIIPTYHDWDRLQLCFNALGNQTIPRDSIEIIVINNDPADLSPQKLDVPSNAKIITEPRPGSYAARNTAVRQSRGSILAFTDSDCIPENDWLERALEKFQNNTVDRIGGKVVVFCKDDNQKSSAELYDTVFAFQQEKAINKIGYSVTANLIVRKSRFLEVGYFNDKLYSGGDHEWNMRANKKGLSLIYTPDVIVNHPARKTIRELEKKVRRVMGSGSWSISQNFFEELYNRLYMFLSKFVKLALVTLRTKKLTISEKRKVIKVILHLYLASVDEYHRLRKGGNANRE